MCTFEDDSTEESTLDLSTYSKSDQSKIENAIQSELKLHPEYIKSKCKVIMQDQVEKKYLPNERMDDILYRLRVNKIKFIDFQNYGKRYFKIKPILASPRVANDFDTFKDLHKNDAKIYKSSGEKLKKWILVRSKMHNFTPEQAKEWIVQYLHFDPRKIIIQDQPIADDPLVYECPYAEKDLSAYAEGYHYKTFKIDCTPPIIEEKTQPKESSATLLVPATELPQDTIKTPIKVVKPTHSNDSHVSHSTHHPSGFNKTKHKINKFFLRTFQSNKHKRKSAKLKCFDFF